MFNPDRRGIGLVLLFLVACSPSQQSDPAFQAQTKYFLESLQLVESAGRQLQGDNYSKDLIQQALTKMDEGLKFAFQVENQFLNKLDDRLANYYQRYFVKGIESYRLGIEAGDKNEQREGLKLLALWAQYWDREKATVSAKL